MESPGSRRGFLFWKSLRAKWIPTGLAAEGLARGRLQGHIVGMQTRCPKCTSTVRSTGTSWEILNAGCEDLAGTRWAAKPEYCPTLSDVVRDEVILPGVTDREVVLAEIAQVRVVKVHS